MNDQVKSKIIPAKKDQLLNYVDKVWGYEEWIANSESYCGKKLVLKKGFQCSMHHHKIKDETFYVASGKVFLEMEYEGKKTARIMTAGDVQHIKIGLWHRFIGLEEAEIFEFSTYHRDSDSYRRENSGEADLSKINV